MEIKKLMGKRIYLEMPEEPKSTLHLDEESKLALEAEKMKTWGKLKVYAVGSNVVDITEGDMIMIDPNAVTRILKIPLSEDRTVLLVSEFDVAHVWD